MQRAVDQVFQDVALPGLPVVFALDRAGAVGEDGETHQGLYDIALFRSMSDRISLHRRQCLRQMAKQIRKIQMAMRVN